MIGKFNERQVRKYLAKHGFSIAKRVKYMDTYWDWREGVLMVVRDTEPNKHRPELPFTVVVSPVEPWQVEPTPWAFMTTVYNQLSKRYECSIEGWDITVYCKRSPFQKG